MNRLKSKLLTRLLVLPLILFLALPVPLGSAQSMPPPLMEDLNLPAVGSMVNSTVAFSPALIKGLTVHPEDPFLFNFLIQPGQEEKPKEEVNKEAMKMVKYFMAALTVPEEEMWVNLSPYEKNRIIPEGFGDTEMGRDLLAQDYLLKQMMASLMYPEKEIGREFWDRVYAQAYRKYGTTDIPMDTFNKVWIVPDRAVIHENGLNVFVVESRMKVLTEADYLSSKHDAQGSKEKLKEKSLIPPSEALATNVLKEIIIPELEREVNEGKTFANLRQISNAVILATWYKKNVIGSALNDVYVNRKKTAGVDTQDKQVNQKIYARYIESFKRGVYDLIKEEYDPVRREVISRKYFSGGVKEKWELEKADDDFAITSNFLRGAKDFQVRLIQSAKQEKENWREPLNSIRLTLNDVKKGVSLFNFEGLIELQHLFVGILDSLDFKLREFLLSSEEHHTASEKRLVIDRNGKKRILVYILENIFIHAVENAIDGYLQGIEDQYVGFEKDLTVDFYAYSEGGDIVIDVVNNGVPLYASEDSLKKKRKRDQGQVRIGGKNKGFIRMRQKVRLLHPEATVNLFDRQEFYDNVPGVVLRIQWPLKNNPYQISLENVKTIERLGVKRVVLAPSKDWRPVEELERKIAVNFMGQISFSSAEPIVSLKDEDFDFYWTRHGQTFSNSGNFAEGKHNELTPQGIQASSHAAEELFERLKGEIEDGAELLILTSQRERTKATAKPLIDLIYTKLGIVIQPEEEPFLNELANGIGLEETIIAMRQNPEAKDYLQRFNRGLDAMIKPPRGLGANPSAESYKDLLIRTKEGLEQLKEKVRLHKLVNGNRKVIVVAFVHSLQASAMRVVLGDQSIASPQDGIINWRKNPLMNATPFYFNPDSKRLVDLNVLRTEDYAMAVKTAMVANKGLSAVPPLRAVQSILDKVDFTSTDVNKDGYETYVLRKKGLGFVIKIYNGSAEQEAETRQNYQLAIDRLLEKGLIARTYMDQDVTISYEGKKVDVPQIIIQEETIPLNDLLDLLIDQGKEEMVKYLLKQKVRLDEQILEAGLFVTDSFFKNVGVTSEGKVVLFDLGNIVEDVHASSEQAYDMFYKRGEPLGYAHRMNKRGRVLYQPIFFLQMIKDKALAKRLIDYYVKVSGLNFQDLSGALEVSDVEPYKDDIEQFLQIVNPVDLFALPDSLAPFEQKDMIYEYVLRNKYSREFIAIAEEEYARDFNKGNEDFAQAAGPGQLDYPQVVDLKDLIQEKLGEFLSESRFKVKADLREMPMEVTGKEAFTLSFTLEEIIRNIAEHADPTDVLKEVTVQSSKEGQTLVLALKNPGVIPYDALRKKITEELSEKGSLLYSNEFKEFALLKQDILEMFAGEDALIEKHLRKILRGEKIIRVENYSEEIIPEAELPFVHGLGELGVGLFVARKKIRNEFKGEIKLESNKQQNKTIAKVILPLNLLNDEKENTREVDEALAVERKGGIDLSPRNLKIEVNKDNSEIQFLPYALSDDLQSINGFTPILLEVNPITNIPQLLGIQ